MTSKISFFKLMREDIKRKLWLVVLAILVFFISFPVAAMVMIDNIGRHASSLLEGEMKGQAVRDVFLVLLGYGNIWMVVVTIAGAALCGIFSFSYLYKKKKVDFYHSIPVRRETLFFVSYLNGLLIYVIPYLASILICVLIGGRYFTKDTAIWGIVFREFGVQILFFLLLYHSFILSSVLAGNMFGCLFLNGVAQCYMIFVQVIYIGYCKNYFKTYSSFYENFYDSIAKFSPIIAFSGGIKRLMESDAVYLLRVWAGEASLQLYLMQCFLAAVLILGIAVYLYKIRSSEMAGKAIAFPKIQPIVRILLVIPCAMTGGWIFVNLTSRNQSGWMLFGILFSAILVHGVIEVLYQSDIRGIFSHKIQLAAASIVAVMITLSFQNDWFGYDAYVPKLEEMESAAIYIDNIQIDSSYYIKDTNQGVTRLLSSSYALEKMKLNGELLPVIQQLMSLGAQKNENDDVSAEWIRFYVRVNRNNKKEVMRCYTVPLDQAYDLLQKVFQSQEYKEKSYAHFLESWERAENVYISISSSFTGENGTLSQREGREFLEIYRRELMELTLDDIRDNPTIGQVEYSVLNGSLKEYHVMLLYSVMTESIAYLEKVGILENGNFSIHPKASDLDAVEFWKSGEEWNEEKASYGSFYKLEMPKEKEQIEKLCEMLYFYDENNPSIFWNGSKEYEIYLVFQQESEERNCRVMLRYGDEIGKKFLEELMQNLEGDN